MKTKKPVKITKNMTFGEIMKKNPKVMEILMLKGMRCIECPAASQETLEQGALMHGLDADKLVEEINKKSKNKRKK